MKNPIKQLFGQTAVYGLGIVLPRLLNYLLLTPFYTRVFDKGSYGVITELYAYLVFLIVILTYGMETGFFRYASNSQRKEQVYKTGLLSLLFTSVLFILLVLVFSKGLSNLIGYSEHPEYLRLLGLIVGIDAFTSLPFAYIRLRNRPGKYAFIRILEVGVNILLNLFFLYYCPKNQDAKIVSLLFDPNIGVGYVLISNALASSLKLLLLLPEIFFGFRGRFSAVLLRILLRYSYPLLLAGLAGTINEALDRVLLKHLIPPSQHPMEQLGIYGANFKLAVLMTLFVQMFKYAAEPFFFSKSGEKDVKLLYADVMTFFVVTGLGIFLIVMLFIDHFVLFIGVDFREGQGIVPIVLLANLVMGIFFNLSIWYKLTNRTMIGAVLVLVGAAITIVVNLAFVPRYGYFASAWAHLLCYSFMVVLSYILSRKHYAVPYRLLRIAAYIGLSLVLFGMNKVLLPRIDGYGGFLAALLLLLYASIVIYFERKTFLKYQ